MKKVISVLMTVAMLAALMVPAFALDQNTPSGDTMVKTSTTMEGGQDARRYTVTIPAETEITWGAESTTLDVTAEAHLFYNEKLYVSVAGSGKMVYTPEEGTSFELPYTLGGEDLNYVSADPVVYPAAALDFKVNVTTEDWNEAVVGAYSDTLTFTAEAK